MAGSVKQAVEQIGREHLFLEAALFANKVGDGRLGTAIETLHKDCGGSWEWAVREFIRYDVYPIVDKEFHGQLNWERVFRDLNIVLTPHLEWADSEDDLDESVNPEMDELN
jgi:hypothetical protein